MGLIQGHVIDLILMIIGMVCFGLFILLYSFKVKRRHRHR